LSNSKNNTPKDVDDKIRASADKVAAVKDLKAKAEDAKPTAQQKKTSQAKKSVVQDNSSSAPKAEEKQPIKFKSFEVLGEDADGKIHFWSSENKKIYAHDLKSLQFDQLVQIGGQEIRNKVGRGRRYDQEGEDGSMLIPFQSLKEWLIIEASRRQLGILSYFGQGIHLLKDGRLLIVNGGEGYVWDGNKFAPQDHPLVGGRLIDWNKGRHWIDFSSVQKMVNSMTINKSKEIVAEACELVNQWGFADQQDVYLFAGWMLAQIVQPVWSWRPHLWLTGSAGSGKTQLLSLLEGLSGPLAMRREGKSLTEAGFRQDMGSDGVYAFIDEFEKSEHRDALIEYLRSASRGGTIVKGTTAQKPVHFFIRHSVLLASIEYSLARSAERSRFLIVELKKDDSRKPVLPNAAKMEELRLQILGFALWASFRAKTLIETLGRIPGFEDRLVESYAVPLSMISLCESDPLNVLRNMVTTFLHRAQLVDQQDVQTDEEKILRDLCFAKVRVPMEQQTSSDKQSIVYLDFGVAQALDKLRQASDSALDDALQAVGIKLTNEGPLFIVPDIVTRKLLRDTPWGNLNLEPILKRITGAKKHRLRIAGSRCYGLLLPENILSGAEHAAL
jgi:hypothetical protein